MDLFRKLFSGQPAEPSADPGGSETHDVRVATCALFLEMASVDGEFSAAERERILEILTREHDLAREDADQLTRLARRERKRSIDLWRFTHLINERYTEEEKIQVMELLWRVVYTDGKLEKHEDYLVHKVANLLRLTHAQLIAAKRKVLAEARGEG